jgi:hypothetical protein
MPLSRDKPVKGGIARASRLARPREAPLCSAAAFSE